MLRKRLQPHHLQLRLCWSGRGSLPFDELVSGFTPIAEILFGKEQERVSTYREGWDTIPLSLRMRLCWRSSHRSHSRSSSTRCWCSSSPDLLFHHRSKNTVRRGSKASISNRHTEGETWSSPARYCDHRTIYPPESLLGMFPVDNMQTKHPNLLHHFPQQDNYGYLGRIGQPARISPDIPISSHAMRDQMLLGDRRRKQILNGG